MHQTLSLGQMNFHVSDVQQRLEVSNGAGEKLLHLISITKENALRRVERLIKTTYRDRVACIHLPSNPWYGVCNFVCKLYGAALDNGNCLLLGNERLW